MFADTPIGGGGVVVLSRMFAVICKNILSQIFDPMIVTVKYFIPLQLSLELSEPGPYGRGFDRKGWKSDSCQVRLETPPTRRWLMIGASLIIRRVSRGFDEKRVGQTAPPWNDARRPANRYARVNRCCRRPEFPGGSFRDSVRFGRNGERAIDWLEKGSFFAKDKTLRQGEVRASFGV
jgi:hypothetical protein